VDRNKRDSLVLVPGWATDYRIFNFLDLEFNYLLPIDFSPFDFELALFSAIKENNLGRISLFGWSLGGFAAGEFARRYTGLVNELILVSIRKEYRKEELARVKEYLKKNKKAYLYKFYRQCFYKKEHWGWFRKNLLSNYCEEFDLSYLLKTLDYLADAEIKPEQLKDIKKIRIVHSECDSIAPIEEAIDIKNCLNQAEFISIKGTGHLPFLDLEFLC